jgi:hypothetical protein
MRHETGVDGKTTLAIETPDGLHRNADTWLHAEPEQRLVRTMDGHARAFLSDRYRRLDNADLLAHVYPMLVQLTAWPHHLRGLFIQTRNSAVAAPRRRSLRLKSAPPDPARSLATIWQRSG